MCGEDFFGVMIWGGCVLESTICLRILGNLVGYFTFFLRIVIDGDVMRGDSFEKAKSIFFVRYEFSFLIFGEGIFDIFDI